MKKIIGIILIITAFILFGISTMMILSNKTNNKLESNPSNNNSDKNELNFSIDDFVFEGKDEIYSDTYKKFNLNFINNSNCHILEADIKFKVKNEITNDDKEKFKELLKLSENAAPQDVEIEINFYELIKKEEKKESISFKTRVKDTLAYRYIYQEHFDLMELTMLHLTVIAPDNRIYTAIYNFNTKKWQLEELKYKNKEWPKEGIAKKIAIPNKDFVIVYPDSNERKVTAKILEATKEDYVNYVEEIKKLGFTIETDVYDSNTHGQYKAKNKNNDEIEITFSSTLDTMLITARAY